ncbi:MAG: nucleotide pyrophosphohydrolase [Clostridiaceae bacterium]
MERKLIKEILKFSEERNWKQYHNPKDLAISISLEASELLENFQWSSSEESIEKKLDNVKDELADVLIYSILFADSINVDINQIITEKLEKNSIKYPIDKAFGKKEKYTEL